MIVGCPQCNRRYRLSEEYLSKYIRCVCSAVLKVTPGKIDSNNEVNKTQAPSIPSQNSNTISKEPVKYGVSIMDSVIFPDLINLVDLSKFSSNSSSEEEDNLPEIEQELPSFDEDNFENEDTEARQTSLENLDIKGPEKLDARIPEALKALNKSQDPKFIVNMLYFLLEVKHPEIKDTVTKFLNNPNPLAAYFAKRIISDLDKMQGVKKSNSETVVAYDRTKLFKIFFKDLNKQKFMLLRVRLITWNMAQYHILYANY